MPHIQRYFNFNVLNNLKQDNQLEQKLFGQRDNFPVIFKNFVPTSCLFAPSIDKYLF